MIGWIGKIKHYFERDLFWIALGILPCLLAVGISFRCCQNIQYTERKALYLKRKQDLRAKKDLELQSFHKQLQTARCDYIEKELESLEFLSSEALKLRAVVHSQPENAALIERLKFLEGDENRLRFRQQNFQRLDRMQEVEAIAKHPVELDREDLLKLLSRIENRALDTFAPANNPPDLIIRKFDLIRKPLSSDEEHFVVNLELIKREMIHE